MKKRNIGENAIGVNIKIMSTSLKIVLDVRDAENRL